MTTHPIPTTDAERTHRAETLLAAVTTITYSLTSRAGRAYQIEQLLAEAGYHPGQVDADGLHVPPPHDDCRQCADLTEGATR